ncbi:hypothetical protein ANAEL_04817 [Anaerolineales bacterium]|nr:hypothetical protein ANAEL_04817 [Anaerolineales bacterium]
MLRDKLTIIVKAVRLRYAIPFVLLLMVVYLTVVHPWMANWGSNEVEQQMVLPGDELIPHLNGKSTLAITINVAPDVVWKWLVQVGQDRAGFYSYTWLENLIGANIHNTDEIRPEWQHLAVGDGWRLVPSNYLWGVGKDAVSPVLIIEPDHVLVLEMFGAHVLEPVDEHNTRLIVRGQSGPTNALMVMLVDPIVFTMERRMLLGLKARAEGRPDVPVVLMVIAWFGWITSGIAVAVLFLIERHRLYWLILPITASLPPLVMSHDIQSGLAAFLAVGITILGFLFFGRSWWGCILVIGSIVMLTLLLAPEAFTAIGFVFTLLLLVTVSMLVTVRIKAHGVVLHRLTTPNQ